MERAPELYDYWLITFAHQRGRGKFRRMGTMAPREGSGKPSTAHWIGAGRSCLWRSSDAKTTSLFFGPRTFWPAAQPCDSCAADGTHWVFHCRENPEQVTVSWSASRTAEKEEKSISTRPNWTGVASRRTKSGGRKPPEELEIASLVRRIR
jgi:hypothetical protein